MTVAVLPNFSKLFGVLFATMLFLIVVAAAATAPVPITVEIPPPVPVPVAVLLVMVLLITSNLLTTEAVLPFVKFSIPPPVKAMLPLTVQFSIRKVWS